VTRLVVVGDALLDRDLVGDVDRVCPDAPVPVLAERAEHARPGGAGLAALLAARGSTVDVTLVTALAPDQDGALLRSLLAGVTVVALPATGRTPVKTRVRASGQSLLRIDRGTPAAPPGPPTAAALSTVDGADAVLVSDYGRGLTGQPELRAALAWAARRVPVVWDPHPLGAAPVPGCRLVTPNLAEAAGLTGLELEPGRYGEVGAAAAELVRRWRAGAVAITLGARGALLSFGAEVPLLVPAPDVSTSDTCGAGDRFAAAAATALATGRLPSEAVTAAVLAAADFVAAGGAAAMDLGDRAAADPGPARSSRARRRRAGLASGGSAPRPDASGFHGAGLDGAGFDGARPDGARPDGARPDGARPDGAWPDGARPDGAGLDGGPAAGVDGVEVARRVRAAGGTVVATGGCFDLLHAGHVALLDAARRLGDCLVVCLNSDDSVRRLKGPDRPVVGQRDRARVLQALSSVDATVVFDEDDPGAALGRIRPHLWVKGGDYAGIALPEEDVLAGWGGRAVLLPYLADHSSTDLIEQCRAGGTTPPEGS
jgi:D-beta-D-heptose 7-phosphate kinase / D-beta-D-heptose 1-phosphate adenosyltransferase